MEAAQIPQALRTKGWLKMIIALSFSAFTFLLFQYILRLSPFKGDIASESHNTFWFSFCLSLSQVTVKYWKNVERKIGFSFSRMCVFETVCLSLQTFAGSQLFALSSPTQLKVNGAPHIKPRNTKLYKSRPLAILLRGSSHLLLSH